MANELQPKAPAARAPRGVSRTSEGRVGPSLAVEAPRDLLPPQAALWTSKSLVEGSPSRVIRAKPSRVIWPQLPRQHLRLHLAGSLSWRRFFRSLENQPPAASFSRTALISVSPDSKSRGLALDTALAQGCWGLVLLSRPRIRSPHQQSLVCPWGQPLDSPSRTFSSLSQRGSLIQVVWLSSRLPAALSHAPLLMSRERPLSPPFAQTLSGP